MKCIGVLTSGGDAPGMNAVIWSTVRAAHARGMKVMGIEDGYQGLIERRVHELTAKELGNCLDLGGTCLGTARCKAMMTDEGRDEAATAVREFGIEGIIVCGGDGSYRGAQTLSERGIPTIGLPGTIDNDLAYTDFTIGYDTACNTATEAAMKIRDTMTSHHRFGIIEVMGRRCGDIALSVGLVVGADYILVPEIQYETPYDMENIAKRLTKLSSEGAKSGLIILAEGVEYDTPNRAEVLCDALVQRTGLEIRSTVLGHMQRGGYPSVRDRSYAIQMTERAVELLHKGIGNRVVGVRHNQIIDMDIVEALQTKQTINKDLYDLAQQLGSVR